MPVRSLSKDQIFLQFKLPVASFAGNKFDMARDRAHDQASELREPV